MAKEIAKQGGRESSQAGRGSRRQQNGDGERLRGKEKVRIRVVGAEGEIIGLPRL
jgi:hypothetical protein